MPFTGLTLDLGCGSNKADGALGVDGRIVSGVDIVGKVDSLPIASNSAHTIYLSHVLEHVPELISVMEEIWRVCKPGARVYIWSPHFSCGLYSWGDPTHVRTMSTTIFDFLIPETAINYYTTARFTIEKRELHYAFRRTGVPVQSPDTGFPRLKSHISRFIEPLANKNRILQVFCERVWAPWIGFEEVYFELVCVKDS